MLDMRKAGVGILSEGIGKNYQMVSRFEIAISPSLKLGLWFYRAL